MKLLNAINESLNKSANTISSMVGTMWCAIVFAVIGITGVVAAFTGNTLLVLIVGAISGYFLQLVLLPIIMVAQNIQAKAQEEHQASLDRLHDKLKDHSAILTSISKGSKK